MKTILWDVEIRLSIEGGKIPKAVEEEVCFEIPVTLEKM